MLSVKKKSGEILSISFLVEGTEDLFHQVQLPRQPMAGCAWTRGPPTPAPSCDAPPTLPASPVRHLYLLPPNSPPLLPSLPWAGVLWLEVGYTSCKLRHHQSRLLSSCPALADLPSPMHVSRQTPSCRQRPLTL